MKTFKEFTEQWTPKSTFNKPPGKDSGLLDRIKSQEDIDNEKREFMRVTGIPLAKKQYGGKINSDVLKAYPELNPDNPRDYIKLKRLSAKIKKV